MDSIARLEVSFEFETSCEKERSIFDKKFCYSEDLRQI
jgi:hypothetical protein